MTPAVRNSTPRQQFKAASRLTDPAGFKIVRARGKRFSDSLLRISAMRNDLPHARLGLAIATKTLGTAVARNRIKRIVRESFRLNQHKLPAVDITVAVTDAARGASAAALRASLLQHWKTILERCAKS